MGVPIPPNPMEELEKNRKRAELEDMSKATLTCPHCGHKQVVEIPQNSCLAFHKCVKCEKLISVTDGSDSCCVICEHSNKLCPVGHKTKKKSVEDRPAPSCACCS